MAEFTPTTWKLEMLQDSYTTMATAVLTRLTSAMDILAGSINFLWDRALTSRFTSIMATKRWACLAETDGLISTVVALMFESRAVSIIG